MKHMYYNHHKWYFPQVLSAPEVCLVISLSHKMTSSTELLVLHSATKKLLFGTTRSISPWSKNLMTKTAKVARRKRQQPMENSGKLITCLVKNDHNDSILYSKKEPIYVFHSCLLKGINFLFGSVESSRNIH